MSSFLLHFFLLSSLAVVGSLGCTVPPKANILPWGGSGLELLNKAIKGLCVGLLKLGGSPGIVASAVLDSVWPTGIIANNTDTSYDKQACALQAAISYSVFQSSTVEIKAQLTTAWTYIQSYIDTVKTHAAGSSFKRCLFELLDKRSAAGHVGFCDYQCHGRLYDCVQLYSAFTTPLCLSGCSHRVDH